jgi:hypothetical protein
VERVTTLAFTVNQTGGRFHQVAESHRAQPQTEIDVVRLNREALIKTARFRKDSTTNHQAGTRDRRPTAEAP